MKHIFYFMSIAPILWEAMSVANVKRTHSFIINMKGKKYNEYTDAQKSLSICLIGYFIWNFVGLFTFQWPIFVFIFCIGFIPKTNIYLRWIDSFVSLLILLFVILNSYHFKIDLYQLILTQIQK